MDRLDSFRVGFFIIFDSRPDQLVLSFYYHNSLILSGRVLNFAGAIAIILVKTGAIVSDS